MGQVVKQIISRYPAQVINMFKLIAFALAVTIVTVNGAPKPEPNPSLAAYAVAPVVPGVVSAVSSQVIARNYNTLAAPLVAAAPVVRAAPLVAAPAVASYLASPYVSAPVASPYVSAPLVYV